MIALALTLLCSRPLAEPVRDTTDSVEVNHFYDGEGQPIFTQLIWENEEGVIIAWRLQKEGRPQPYKCWRTGGYITAWHDGDTLREVWSRTYEETWTQFDRECEERAWVPVLARRGFTPARRPR